MTAASPYVVNMHGGAIVDLLNPLASSIDPASVMSHLSRITRWGGNVQFDYCVLQHSMIVADAMSRAEEKIYGFIHDWPEGILGFDAPSPAKLAVLSRGGDINAIERRLMTAIYRRLEIVPPSTETAQRVHEADMRARATEIRDVVANTSGLTHPAPPLSRRVSFATREKLLDQAATQLDSYLYLAKGGA